MSEQTANHPLTKYRWTICALIFFATTVNYLDRQLFSLMVPFFEDELKLGPTDLALINVSFILPYGLSMMFVGRVIDRIGIRKGLGGAFLLWNLASIAHASVRSLTGFMSARFLLGIGESGMFPAAIKTMTNWFPLRERALATGYFNAGSNMGAILAPLLGVAVATVFGWRACFVLVGGCGIAWIFFWNRMYAEPEDHPKVHSTELAHIRSDLNEHEAPLSATQLFSLKPLYGLLFAKALSDAPWWFYLTWMPKFLVDQFHLDKTFMAIAIPVIYLIADVGSIAGGWMSSALIKKGMPVGKSRKLTMLACALAVTPVMSVGLFVDRPALLGIGSIYWVVGIVALAAGAHQGWSCNMFTLVSDTIPKSAIAMAIGVINGFGMVGASALQFFVGRTVQLTNSYTIPFMVAGSLYLVALLGIQIMVPKVEPHFPTKKSNMPAVIAGGLAILAALAFLQYDSNKPPFKSLDDYRQKLEAKGTKIIGGNATATIGWMKGLWFELEDKAGKTKFELVKLDTQGRPFVEPKGAKASKYEGPKETELKALIETPAK